MNKAPSLTQNQRLIQSPIIQITRESSEEQPQQPVLLITTTYDQNTKQMSTTTKNNTGETEQGTNDSKNNNNNLEMMASHESSKTSLPSTSSANPTNININLNQTNLGGNTDQKLEKLSSGETTHAYKKRFFILALFCSHSAINSFQWIQYSSITNVIAHYYGASNLQVNLTSLVFMITYIPFIIHASLLLEKFGLRKAVLLGTLGTALGSLVKWLMGSNEGITSFYYMMAGQTIVALSQLFIISIPPLLAAVWFPDHQVSTATGIGVFGNQLGIALGFIVPPMVISGVDATKDVIGDDLRLLSCAIFWISFIICIVSFIALEDKPPKPPGSASLHAAHQHEDTQTTIKACASIKELCQDGDFRYLILSYGINVGVFYAVSTVLNQMVAIGWPNLLDLAGKMGLLIVVSGMAGSVICGQLLDRTHAYKLIIALIYLFSLISMLLFTLVLRLFTDVWPLYLASIALGFFMTGYLPLGFEFAAEITYPHPANTPAGLLNLSAQVFGLILTYASSLIVDKLGDLWANTFLTISLCVGLFLTVIMKADLKRQKAVAEEQMKF